MAILSKGVTFASGDQVTATGLNNLVDQATFASGAVDGSTTQLSSGAIIVKDGGITPAKLSSGGPTWAANVLTITNGLNVGNNLQPGMPVNISGGSTGPWLTFKREGTSCGSIKFDNNTYEFDSTTTQPVVFKVNGTERMRVTSSGSVGIGIASPSRRLHVAGSAGSGVGPEIQLTGDSATPKSWHIATSNADGAAFQIVETGVDTRIAILAGGNVGIGTGTPGSKLSIVGLPTSSSGLSAGDIWSDGGTLKIVT